MTVVIPTLAIVLLKVYILRENATTQLFHNIILRREIIYCIYLSTSFIVFGGPCGNFGPFYNNTDHSNAKDQPRNEMLNSEEKSYNSLFEKFFGGR